MLSGPSFSWRPVVAVIAVVIALAAGWIANDNSASGDVPPRIIEGWAYHGAGQAIACCGTDASNAGGTSYAIYGATWRDRRAAAPSWHEPDGTAPECLGESEAVRVRFGLVDVRPTSDAPGGPVVKWLECL